MKNQPDQASREDFNRWVRDALNHMYDTRFLEGLPLVNFVVGPEQATGRKGQDLRKVLVSTIQTHKPSKGVPAQSQDWRGYQILEQHFLAGLSAPEVMQKLNLSRSLFFLEKARVLKLLSDELWERYSAIYDTPLASPPGTEAGSEGRLDEAANLLKAAAFEAVSIRAIIQSIHAMAESLARVQDINLAIEDEADGVIMKADRVLLRQVLISLIAELIYAVPGGRLEVTTFAEDERIGVRILAEAATVQTRMLRLEERHGLDPETSYQIVAAMGGSLQVESLERGQYSAELSWPANQGPRTVLVIDDHPDVAELFERYLAGTDWKVVQAESAEQARRVLASLTPTVILLDVILPQEDGWEFLEGLKADPQTRAIPVIVCSAINEPDLVRSLGAEGYLPKPVSQTQVIKALQPWGGISPN